MFSYISKTVGKAYKASKKIVKGSNDSSKNSPTYKLINSLCKEQADVLSITKMNEISKLSYEYAKFEEICSILFNKLELHSHSDISCYRYVRNLLLLCSYLIKHGAGGFID